MASRALVPPMSPASTSMRADPSRPKANWLGLFRPARLRCGRLVRMFVLSGKVQSGGAPMRLHLVSLAAALCTAAAARAQVAGELILPGDPDSTWSATAGRTVGAGNGVFHGEIGWPGVSVEYLHGFDSRTDLGFRAS